MENKLITDFIKRIETESEYNKTVDEDIIKMLINIFEGIEIKKSKYKNDIKNSIDLALAFYKDYNKDFYRLIIEGLNNKRIIISDNKNMRSIVNIENKCASIKLIGNDSDAISIVHELAHYIDENSKPMITQDYHVLCEVFSLYMEKRFEEWLDNNTYKELINTRRKRRLYHEKLALEIIKLELYYENLFKSKKNLEESDINIKDIELINDVTRTAGITANFVNFFIRYPIGNILSYSLINNNIKDDNNILNYCLETNVTKAVKDFNDNEITKIMKLN